jgi:hypothetical protein
MAILNNSNAISSGGYDINNSLRFRGTSVSSYLNRTLTTPTLGTKWTWSGWIKRGALFATKPDQVLLATQGAGAQGSIFFNSADFISLAFGGAIRRNAVAVLRDPSAWYHVVVSVDTTQASEPNRAILYINGIQQTWTTSSAITQNDTTQINQAVVHNIGANSGAGAPSYFDGYMAEVNFIDGQALTPSSFGSTNATTGVWQPARYTGTFGTNGFYLKFSDIATTSGSNAGLGKDFSGNANYWTTNNISVTAGVTYDAMIDSPTLTSATVANYATLNPVYKSASQPTFSNANLTVAGNTNNYQNSFSTIGVTSGKWYAEIVVTGTPNSANMIGVSNQTQLNYLCSTADILGTSSGGTGYGYYIHNGNKYSAGTSTTYGNSIASGDIVGIALDLDNGKIWFSKNGTWQASGDPAAGTNAAFTGIASDTWSIGSTSYSTGATSLNHTFGQRPFSYTPPTGFVRLNTYNLPDSTIKKGNSYMDATLYTGTGATLSITNAGSFKPDFIWTKCRSNVVDNCLVDAVRGGNKILYSNLTNVEDTASFIDSFNTGGYTINSGAGGGGNTNTRTYVGWQWQAGQGSTSSNTSGSITSTVSVNTTAGFSVVTYTGNGTSGATVGHGLGVAPKMIINKSRATSATDWGVYHASNGNTGAVFLNDTSAFITNSGYWNNTSPASSVFTLGLAANFNQSGQTYVAYCWAEIAGFSKAFSYTGNASTDGPFVFCNFRPRFILFKNSSAVTVWIIFDTARNTYNFVDTQLRPNASDADNSAGSAFSMDILSNGFKVRSSDSNFNGSGNTIIGMAFAENPFKNSNAR